MNRFHEYIPQHRETVNRGRSVLCCKHRQNSSLIFKPSPFTFEVLHLTIPPCVTEQREPELSVAITIQAAGRSRKPSSVAGLGCLSVRWVAEVIQIPFTDSHGCDGCLLPAVKCCWWRKQDSERWSRGLQHPLMSRDNWFGCCGIKRPWMNMMLRPKTPLPSKMTPAQKLQVLNMLNGGELHLYCSMAVGHNSIEKASKLSSLDENNDLFAPVIHLILLQFSVAGSAGSLFQWPLL